MVKDKPLVVVHESGMGRPTEKVARKLHHVVSAAVFRGRRAELRSELSRVGVPRFMIAGAARAVGSFAHHFIPKILGYVPITAISGKFVQAGSSDHLRNMDIDMQTFEFI